MYHFPKNNHQNILIKMNSELADCVATFEETESFNISGNV